MLTGGLASWKLLSLLVQCTFCVDMHVNILPNNSSWTGSLSQRNRSIKFSKHWKIREVTSKAMYSTMEVYFAMAKKQMSVQKLSNLVYIINLCATHLTVLMALNFELTCAGAGVDMNSRKARHYQGIKMHMMTHFPSAKLFWGAPSFLTDMELPELSHLRTKGMFLVVLYNEISVTSTLHISSENFETSSKNYSETPYDLLRIDARRRNAKYLIQRANGPQVDQDSTTEGYTFKSHAIINFEQKCMLVYKDGSLKFLQALTTTFPRALHPIVSLVKLTSMLREFSKQPHVDCVTTDLLVNAFTINSEVKIGLLHTLQCCGNVGLCLEPFVLRADNYFVPDINRKHSGRT